MGQQKPIANFINENVGNLEALYPGSSDFLNMCMTPTRQEEVLVYHGSFRHWGHPAIDYLEGLESLHQNVTAEKDIDEEYANALASDLALKVLQKKFKEEKKWYVNKEDIRNNHPLKKHIRNNTWPTPAQIEDFGDDWHTLPLLKCFDIPDVIDPSQLYSDKSHSMNRSDVLQHVLDKPTEPIPTKKVLQTLLTTPSTNWNEFLNEIDQNGLPKEDLVIGLKGKEREVKRRDASIHL